MKTSAEAAELRHLAEAQLQERKKAEAACPPTAEETQRLVHELQVHQIELEMQNEELRQSRATAEAISRQYTDLYDFAPTGYFTLDRDGTICQVNLTGARLMGMEPSGLVNRRFGLFVSTAFRPAFSAFLEELFALQAERICEVVLLKEAKPEQPFWVHIVAAVVEGKAGHGASALCRIAVTDVTDHKHVEDELRKAEEFVRNTLNGLSSHIAIVEEDGTILAVNEAWRDFAAANPPLGDNVCEGANYLAACDRATGDSCEGAAEFAHGVRDVLAGLRNDFQIEYFCHSPNEQRWFIGRVTRFPTEGPPRVVIAHENITARKQVEVALQNHLTFISTLIETIPIPLFYKDTNGAYAGCNRAFAEFLGLTRGEVVGRTVYHVAPRELADMYRRMDDTLLAQGPGRIQVYESIVKRADGMNREVVFRNATYSDSDGRVAGILGIIQDVTDLKESHRKVRERESELAHVARVASMGQMAAAIAHEINQPLHAISNYTAGAILRLEAGDADTEPIISAMKRSAAEAHRASAVIRRIRRVIQKHGERSSTMSINEAVRNALALLQHDLNEGGFEVHLKLGEALPTVVGDSVHIEQVLANLIRNATEAMASTPAGERRITISTSGKDARSIEVSVQDTGPGLSGENVDKVFDAFFTTKSDGLGMGLAICRFLTEAHEGRIWAKANNPRGATFRFSLPCSAKEVDRD